MMRVLDKLICMLVAAPPLYMMFRFVRWYMRADVEQPVEEAAEATES